jgi:hypothetical protein
MRQPLQSLVARLKDGHGGVLLIAGARTRLSLEAADLLATSDLMTLNCQGYEAERSLRFAALADLVRPLKSDLFFAEEHDSPFALGRAVADLLKTAAQERPVLA